MSVIKFDNGAWSMVRVDGHRLASLETHDSTGGITLVTMDRQALAALVGELSGALAAFPHRESKQAKASGERKRR